MSNDKKLKRNNGSVTELAHLRGDTEAFKEGHERIFGKREKVLCKNSECDLSSRQKIGEDFECPHCGSLNEWNDGEYLVK